MHTSKEGTSGSASSTRRMQLDVVGRLEERRVCRAKERNGAWLGHDLFEDELVDRAESDAAERHDVSRSLHCKPHRLACGAMKRLRNSFGHTLHSFADFLVGCVVERA